MGALTGRVKIRATTVGRSGWALSRELARRHTGDRPRPAPWDSSVVDDIADNRPWNLVVRALRCRARMRLRGLRPGSTVVIVNWNTAPLLRVVVPMVDARSSADVAVMVVDNGSSDDSVGYARSLGARVRCLRLPTNVGHAIALDIATLVCRTEVVVTLDSDAFPIDDGWLDVVRAPLRTGAVVAGLRSSRSFVHPVFMAVDVAAFVRERLSFQLHRTDHPGEEELWGVNRWDTAELLSSRVGPERLGFLEPRPRRDLGLPGMTVGGVVYHHGGMSRDASGRQLTPAAIEGFERAVEALTGRPVSARPRSDDDKASGSGAIRGQHS